MEKHVLGVSGGKDSAALAIYMRQHYPELDIEYFFTDTGEELPEVYEFLGKLEGALHKPIKRLNPGRDFKFWMRETGNFLPSPQQRWCTQRLKLIPFKKWVGEWLDKGYTVFSYVAIRSDEDYREAFQSTNVKLKTILPFRIDEIDKEGVMEILDNSGVGLPEYYDWRSRSGCTFCFFQQKIEWVGLKEHHPEAFERAKALEKKATASGSPFTWNQNETLAELEKPERVEQIKKDFEIRLERYKGKSNKNKNYLREDIIDIDEIYSVDEGNGSCNICHK